MHVWDREHQIQLLLETVFPGQLQASYIKEAIFINIESEQITTAVSKEDYIQIPAKVTLKKRGGGRGGAKKKKQTNIINVAHCDGTGGKKRGWSPYY